LPYRIRWPMLSYFIHKSCANQLFVFAYIDPGSGSILLQFLFASVIGAAIYFRKFVGTIFRSLRDKFSRKLK